MTAVPKTYADRPILSAEEGCLRIIDDINHRTPSAIGKIGGVECKVLAYCERLLQPDWPPRLSWRRPGKMMYENAGVFPFTKEAFYRFADFFRKILPDCDLLVAWSNKGEERLFRRYATKAELITFQTLGPFPFIQKVPWTAALAGKKVLLVSPFTETARRQYARKELIWPDHPALRPDFQLLTLRTPLHAHLLEKPAYPDWFVGFEKLAAGMDALDYDVALIGCGAWSLPLAVHAKRRGKVGIHLGGATQLLFGIRGKRWDDVATFQPIINEHWVRPSGDESPPNTQRIEGSCYW